MKSFLQVLVIAFVLLVALFKISHADGIMLTTDSTGIWFSTTDEFGNTGYPTLIRSIPQGTILSDRPVYSTNTRGAIVVVWGEIPFGTQDYLYATTYTPENGWEGPFKAPRMITGETRQYHYYPFVAMDENDDYAVVFNYSITYFNVGYAKIGLLWSKWNQNMYFFDHVAHYIKPAVSVSNGIATVNYSITIAPDGTPRYPVTRLVPE